MGQRVVAGIQQGQLMLRAGTDAFYTFKDFITRYSSRELASLEQDIAAANVASTPGVASVVDGVLHSQHAQESSLAQLATRALSHSCGGSNRHIEPCSLNMSSGLLHE